MIFSADSPPCLRTLQFETVGMVIVRRSGGAVIHADEL